MTRFTSLLLVLMACACGRTQRSTTAIEGGAGAAATGDPSDTPPAGVGPIDVSEQPDALPMSCPARSDAVALQLPCFVGQNIAGPADRPGHHVVECHLVGTPEPAAVSFMLPLAQLPELLNEPLPFPFQPSIPVPPGPGVAMDGQRFVGTLSGVVTFTQVDLDGRAFVATLEQGKIDWTGDSGGFYTCSIDGPLWAIAGGFL